MGFRVELSLEAQADLTEIYEYIRRHVLPIPTVDYPDFGRNSSRSKILPTGRGSLPKTNTRKVTFDRSCMDHFEFSS